MTTPPTFHALRPYTYPQFALAKSFVFRMWCERAQERQQPPPSDLSGACKFASMFMREVFGGVVEGHYAHQYNRIDGRLVDLSHDARDVGAMINPYRHEAEYFDIPEFHEKWMLCAPRVQSWVVEFLREPGRELAQ